MSVSHVRVTSQINCCDVTILSQKRQFLATMANSTTLFWKSMYVFMNLQHINFHFCPLCQDCYTITVFLSMLFVVMCHILVLMNDNKYIFLVIVIVIVIRGNTRLDVTFINLKMEVSWGIYDIIDLIKWGGIYTTCFDKKLFLRKSHVIPESTNMNMYLSFSLNSNGISSLLDMNSATFLMSWVEFSFRKYNFTFVAIDWLILFKKSFNWHKRMK